MMRFAVASALLLFPAAGRSQQGESMFTGRILDGTDSLAVSGVQVQVAGARSTRSDGRGVFSIANVPAGSREISIRMLGYAPYFDRAEFTPGQTVTRGQPLMEIYAPDLVVAEREYLLAWRSLQDMAGAATEIRSSARALCSAAPLLSHRVGSRALVCAQGSSAWCLVSSPGARSRALHR